MRRTARVYQINLPAQTFSGNLLPMSCPAVAESEDAWAARRTGTNAQLRAQDVAVVTVPEPSAAWLRAAGIAALSYLGARRRRG